MRPPRLADWLFWRLAPRRIRGPTLGDLREEYEQYTVRELGPARARIWYWKQVLAILLCYRFPRFATATVHSRTTGLSARSLGGQLVLSGAAVLCVAVWYGVAALDIAHDSVVQDAEARRFASRRDWPAVAEPGILERQIAAYRLEYRKYMEQATNDAFTAIWKVNLDSAPGSTESSQEVPAAWIGWEREHDPPHTPPVRDTGVGEQAWARPANP